MSAYELAETPDNSGRPELSIVETEPHWDALGVTAEYAAHGLSVARGLGGLVLANEIKNNENYQSWKNAATFGALAVTDWIDGALGRWGRRRQSQDETVRRPFNSYVDLFGDKVAVDAVTKAIASREEANGNHLYAEVVDKSADVYIARDILTTVDRIVADKQGIKTNALPGNKITTLKQAVLITAALTPPAKNKVVKTALGMAFASTAKEKVEGGIIMHEHFEEQRRELKEATA